MRDRGGITRDENEQCMNQNWEVHVRDWLIQLNSTLTFLSFQPGSIYFLSIFLNCLLPLYPIRRCTNFLSFSVSFLIHSALTALSVSLFSFLCMCSSVFLFTFPLSLFPSLLEVTGAEEGLCSLSCRLAGTCRAEGQPLCEEMIFSVLRRTLQIISSNLSNGPETLLPLSCNGDR